MLSHFPYRSDRSEGRLFSAWQLDASDNWLLYGHTHSHAAMHADLPRQIQVGWDAWRKPVSEAEILNFMRRNWSA